MKKILGLVVFLLSVSVLWAQGDSLTKVKDSLSNVQLQEFNQKLELIEFQRIQDSLKRIELEEKLNALQGSDVAAKEELEKELQALKEKEDERLENKRLQIEAMKLTTEGFPVLGFYEDTLFHIFAKLGSFSPRDRAQAITDRIILIEDSYNYETDSLIVVASDGTFDIMFGETIVMSVSENDALWNEMGMRPLAEHYAKIISDELEMYQVDNSTTMVLKRIGLLLLVIVLMVLAVIYIRKLFVWTAKKIEAQEGKLLKGIKIRDYTLFDSKREVKVALTLNRLLKWVLIIFALYIALPFAFEIFPATEYFADKLFGYVTNPIKKIAKGLLAYLPNLITIIVIILVFRYVIRGVKFLKSEIENGNLKINGFFPDWANPTFHIVRVLLFAFMVIVIFPYLPGSDSPVFQGVSVFLGFLLTFGSAGSLSNIVAGLVLTYMRLFKLGDRVKIGDVFGDVIEKSLLVTRVRTTKNEIISIPNSTVMSSHTINYSSDAPEKGLIIHTTVTIGYDIPWKLMHETLITAAKRTDLILAAPEPFVLQTSLDDFYVSYQINAYVREANKQAKIYSDLHQNIQDVCNENGIEILSPHYRAARDGNHTTIPSNYLDKDYQAPSFKVDSQNK